MVISKWKGQAEKILAEAFSDKRQQKEKDEHQLVQELYLQIGRLKVEVDFLKKICNFTIMKENISHLITKHRLKYILGRRKI